MDKPHDISVTLQEGGKNISISSSMDAGTDPRPCTIVTLENVVNDNEQVSHRVIVTIGCKAEEGPPTSAMNKSQRELSDDTPNLEKEEKLKHEWREEIRSSRTDCLNRGDGFCIAAATLLLSLSLAAFSALKQSLSLLQGWLWMAGCMLLFFCICSGIGAYYSSEAGFRDHLQWWDKHKQEPYVMMVKFQPYSCWFFLTRILRHIMRASFFVGGILVIVFLFINASFTLIGR